MKEPGAIGCTTFGSCLDSACLEWEGCGTQAGARLLWAWKGLPWGSDHNV